MVRVGATPASRPASASIAAASGGTEGQLHLRAQAPNRTHGLLRTSELTGITHPRFENAGQMETPRQMLGGWATLPRFVLRSDLLLPGDVLLTRPKATTAKLIAGLSAGRFSHAALFVASNMIFESDGGLIGYKLLRRSGWAKDSRHPVSLEEIPAKNVAEATVLRHPRMSSASTCFDDALSTEMSEALGKDYSQLRRLVRLASIPRHLLKPVEGAVSLLDAYLAANKVPGPFCSELVAKVYRRLDLPLFDDESLPESISPNDLARSRLQRVLGAVVDTAQPGTLEFESECEGPDYSTMASTFDAFKQYARRQHGIRKQSDEFEALAASVQRESKVQMNELISGFGQMLGGIRPMLINATGGDLARANRLSEAALDLSQDLVQLAGKDSTTNPQDYQLVLDRLSKFNCRYMRTNALSVSALLRNRAAEYGSLFALLYRPLLWWKRRRTLLRAKGYLAYSASLDRVARTIGGPPNAESN